MNHQISSLVCGLAVALPPLALVAAIGLPPLWGRPLSERYINRATYLATVVGLLGGLAMLGLMLVGGSRYVPLDFGHWVILEEQHFHFHLKFVFDRLSVPFV